MPTERVAVRGSERTPVPDATLAGSPNPLDLVNVTVLVKGRHPIPEPGAEIISRSEFAERYGAAHADIEAVTQFAEEFDLTVGEVNIARRSIELVGTVANMNEAFGTNLRLFQSPQGMFRGRVGALFIPAELSDTIVGVFGLDERPQARARLRRHLEVGPRAAGDTSYTPNQVAKLYGFPASANGTGQTVAIIELGGGFTQADLIAYFGKLGIKVPSVSSVSVDGGLNQPAGDPNSADGEVLLDIEVIGAIATAAKIVVYFAAQYRSGLSRCDLDRGARHFAETLGGLDQLGRPGKQLDGAVADILRPGVPGSGAAGSDGVLRLGRRRVGGRRDGRRGSRGLPEFQPECAGLRRHASRIVGQ